MLIGSTRALYRVRQADMLTPHFSILSLVIEVEKKKMGKER